LKGFARRHGQESGVVLAEALIVISTFVLLLLGMDFFRHLYVGSLKMARLARGSAIAYSMGGCKELDVNGWLGKDRSTYETGKSAQANDSVPAGESMTPAGSGKASSITSKLPGMNGGNGVLNPIYTSVAGGLVSVSTRTGGAVVGGTKKIFQKQLEPRSFVSCGDVVRKGDFDEVLGYVKEAFDW
jgi:hypothetical protein